MSVRHYDANLNLSGGDKESVPSVGSPILPCDPRDRGASPSAHPSASMAEKLSSLRKVLEHIKNGRWSDAQEKCAAGMMLIDSMLSKPDGGDEPCESHKAATKISSGNATQTVQPASVAECSVCGKPYQLTKQRLIRFHRNGEVQCEGGNKLPRQPASVAEIVERAWDTWRDPACSHGSTNFKTIVTRACEEAIAWAMKQQVSTWTDDIRDAVEDLPKGTSKQLREEIQQLRQQESELKGELLAIKEGLSEHGYTFEGNIADATLHFVQRLHQRVKELEAELGRKG